MKEEFFSRAGWILLSALILFVPLVQGGTPRLPTTVVLLGVLSLFALWCGEWGWKAPRQSLHLTVIDGLLGLFFFWTLFSLLFAPYHHSAEKALLLILCYGALYWWLVFHPSLRGMSWCFAAVTVQGLFQAGLTWYQRIGQGLERPAGTFYNPNFLAGFLAVVTVLVLARVVFPSSPERRLAAAASRAAAALFTAGAVVLSGSRGGMVSLAFGIMVLLGGRSLLLALLVTVAGFFGLFAFPNPWFQRLVDLPQIDVYAYSRLSIWRSALEMVRDHPWSGVGLGQYKYISPRYAFPVEAHWTRFGRVAESPHSEYLQVAAELGLPGLLIFLAGLGLLLLWSWRIVRRQSLSQRAGTVPLLAALTAILVHAAVDFPLHTPPAALLAVFLVAGLRIHGVEGPSRPVEFRFRRIYGICLLAVVIGLAALSLRPVVGFWHYLGGLGAPQNLFREKWALEEAPRRIPAPGEAIERMERAVAVDPRNGAYHVSLGSLYFKAAPGGEGEFRRKALFHANYATQLNPNNYRYFVSLGQAMESLYRIGGEASFLQAAAGHYREAVRLAPRHYHVREKLGLLTAEMGRNEEAEAYLREVVRLEPHYLRGWYNMGVFLASRGRVEEARNAWIRGLESARRNWSAVATTPYERALVDFDHELFENSLEKLENMGN